MSPGDQSPKPPLFLAYLQAWQAGYPGFGSPPLGVVFGSPAPKAAGKRNRVPSPRALRAAVTEPAPLVRPPPKRVKPKSKPKPPPEPQLPPPGAAICLRWVLITLKATTLPHPPASPLAH